MPYPLVWARTVSTLNRPNRSFTGETLERKDNIRGKTLTEFGRPQPKVRKLCTVVVSKAQTESERHKPEVFHDTGIRVSD